ncbi:MAG TPA: hypothetical protein VJ810_11865 [Blastocatellia bacterium]|nr:hypothetical protein [Blastocatellia bacterium]
MGFQSLLSRWLVPNRFYGGNVCKGEGFSICAIEFDDQGELWDPQQLEDTIAHIHYECQKSEGGSVSKDQGKAGEVIVITFTHGWMHNASPNDENLRKFSDLIKTRAKAEKDFAKASDRLPRPIIGVYLAWRGLLWDVPCVKYLTFWSRKAAALRIGNLSCTEVLFRIIRAVKSKNNSSQCIFVGHSFGGPIIENAICKALLGSIFMNEGEAADFPSDLVVLINPACEASGAKQFIDILERNKVIVEMGGTTAKDGLTFPILISITSANDKATKLAFPFGQFFVSLLKSFRKYVEPPIGLPSQRRLHSRTAGHIPYFHSCYNGPTPRSNRQRLNAIERMLERWQKAQV